MEERAQQMRQHPDYPALWVTIDGQIWNAERSRWVGVSVTKEGSRYVRYNKPGEAEKTRVRISIDSALRRCYPERFKSAYIKPEARGLSEPGEEWRRYPLNTDYMVSSHRRVWSWRSRRFVGRENRSSANAKDTVLMTFPDGASKEITIEKMYASAFSPDIPSLPGEEWKQYRDPRYYVSNKGRIFSSWQQRVVSPQLSAQDKYFTYGTAFGKEKVHRMVAITFIPNPLGLPQVDHINENRYDNRAANLRWCAQEQNLQWYADNHYR